MYDSKVKWTTLVSDVLPHFNPIHDPRLAKVTNFIDLLSHTSGLGNPVVSWLGAHGAVVLREGDFIDLVNHTLTW